MFVENVGNLVCPAMFDLGEHARVVILSVAEGEDKPIKYPDMFAAADLLLISKTDLLPYVDFNVAQAIEYARRVNPDVETLEVSAKQGIGMTSWTDWIIDQCKHTQPGTAYTSPVDRHARTCARHVLTARLQQRGSFPCP